MRGIKRADGNAAFQGIYGFGAAFPLRLEIFLVLFQVTVDGGRAYCFELFGGFGGDAEGFPLGDEGHLLPHKRGEDLPALEPEKCPDQAEAGCDLIGVDTFPFPVGRPFFLRLQFYRFAGVAHNALIADFRW